MTRQKHLRLLERQPVESGLIEPRSDADSLLVLTTMSGSFLHVLESARVRLVLDLRVLPHFGTSGLTRREVFRVFERRSVIYRDMAGVLGIHSRRDARLSPGVMVGVLKEYLTGDIVGPVLFLVESRMIAHSYAELVPRRPPFLGWRTYTV